MKVKSPIKICKFRQHYVQSTARPPLLFIEHNSSQRDVPINKMTLKSYVQNFKWNCANKLLTGHSVTSTTNEISLRQRIKTLSGAHPAFCLKGNIGFYPNSKRSRVSVVGIYGLRYGLYGSGFEFQDGQNIFLFSRIYRPALEPIQAPTQWVS
jgi:hypothetical protein